MTPREMRLSEGMRWLAQAEKDLNAAKLLAQPEPSRSVFHSQQAAEMAAKGFLAFLHGIFADAEHLTDYAVSFRYVEAPHEPDEPESSQALDIATRLLRHIEHLLSSNSGFESL